MGFEPTLSLRSRFTKPVPSPLSQVGGTAPGRSRSSSRAVQSRELRRSSSERRTSQGWDSNPRSAAYEAAEDDRTPLPCSVGRCVSHTGTAGFEPAPSRVTGERAHQLRHAPEPCCRSQRQRTRGRPAEHRRESRPRQALRRGHPAAGAATACHTHPDGCQRSRRLRSLPLPISPKRIAPPGDLRCAGGAVVLPSRDPGGS